MLNVKIMNLSIAGAMIFFFILYLIFARGKSRGRRIAFLTPVAICLVTLTFMFVVSLSITNRGKVLETHSVESRFHVEAKEIQYDNGVFVLNHDGGVKAFPESITKVYADPRKPDIKHINVTVRKTQIDEGVEILGIWFINPNIKEITTSVIFD